MVRHQLPVHEVLDLDQLLVGDRCVVVEVESQPAVLDEGAGLVGMVADHVAQRPVQDVGAGVALADSIPAGAVDRRRHLLADVNRAR